MVIHNPILTGSFTVNNIDVSSITSSAANITALNATTASLNSFSASVLSYTASQNILNGTYTLTSSFNAQTASFTAFTSSINAFSASILAQTASLNSFSASVLSYTSSLNNKTASFATTGSNTFVGGQYLSSSFNPTGFSTTASLYTDGGLRVTKDAYISGTLYLNNVTVFGTQSVAYITSSQLNISTNLISVNTDTPSVRFGGLSVYDSGSTGLTGSILWDSENNKWIYSNPSGSSYSGGMFISGPRAASLGSETGTTNCMLLAGQGGDHLTSSMIYHDSTVTCIPNTLIGSTVCTTMTNASCIGIGTQTPIAPLTIKSSGATGLFMSCDGANPAVSSRLFFESCFNQFSIFNNQGKLQFNYGASSPSTSGTLGMVMDSSGNFLVGSGTASGTEKLGVTKDDGVGNGLHPIADFNRSLGLSAELVLGYMADGSNVTGPIVWSSNGFPLLFAAGATERLRITATGIACFSCQVCTPHLIGLNNISIGSSCISTDGYNTRLRITNIQNDTFVFAFNNQACKAIMYMYGGNINNPQGYTAWLDNTSGQTNHQISHNVTESTYLAAKGGCVGIGATTPCSLLNVNCVSNGGDSLYTNMFTITTDVSNVYNHLALSPTAIEYRRNTSTGVDLCIMTKVCNGSNGGNIVFAPNLDGASFCSFPRMKIQQNGFIGIGALCAQTYLHICDSLAAGRDDLVRIQTTMSTNHAWYRSTSCEGVNFIAGANRSNNDGNIRGGAAIVGTTTNHDLDIHTNGIRRMTINNSGGVAFIGNSQDYPTVALCGPTYTMIAMGDRSSSAATDVGYISIYNQGTRVIDLPGNADAITFNTGGPMIAGRAYASGDAAFGYQFLEVCNGQTYHGPLSLGNSGGGVALTPLYCGGGKRWGFGWNTAEMNSMTVYNNCTPILINWGVNGDNPTTDRKFCFNYSGNAYASGGTWGTLSSNCVIKTCIVGANSQWSDVKNICIVNYKMKEEIEEYGNAARIHLGVIAEQVAEVSPGLLEEGGYSEKWCACLNGVKTSILHMKAVKALQEAMCRIEILENCLGIN